HSSPSLLLLMSRILLPFFFNDPAPPEIYTLSLHDALPIFRLCASARTTSPSSFSAGFSSTSTSRRNSLNARSSSRAPFVLISAADRKSTRLNSSHDQISYAVFCLKKKKKKITESIKHETTV